MERIRLLIVDDHRLFRQGLAGLLRGEPAFEVAGEAASIEEALVLAGEIPFDVALVDLKMPHVSGCEGIPKLLACQPALGIVVLTASESSSDLLSAVQAGASGYVLKNADADTLFDAIRQVHAGGAALDDLIAPKVIELLRRLSVDSIHDATLTPREHEVLALMMGGADNTEIANRLVISENTVKTHVSHILEKLGMKNRTDLISWAAKSGRSISRVTPE